MRLFISGPRPVLRRLAPALGSDERFDLVGRAETAAEMIEKLAQIRVDVLLLGSEGLDGELIRLTQKISALFPAVKVLVLSRAGSDEQAVECLRAGAAGFLLDGRPSAEVAAAIEVIAQGDRVCPPQVMRLLFTRLGQLGRERKQRDRLEVLELTPREMEILRLLADGLTNRQIADRLYLSVYTVKNHVHRILDALGVQNRWGAVDHAFAKGWLRDPRRGSSPSGNSRIDPGLSE